MTFLTFIIIRILNQTLFGSVINPVVTASAIFTTADLAGAGLKIQGSITAGGNTTLFGVNSNDCYSQGNLTLMSSNVSGGITIGGSLSLSASNFESLTRISSPLYDFQSIRQSLIDTSTSLGQIIPNGRVNSSTAGEMILTGTDPEFNVFQIANPNYYSSIQIIVPPNATSIINIMGEKPFLLQNIFNSFKNSNQNIDPSLVLFNFPQAKTMNLNNGTIAGTLLAPLAAFNISSSIITGGIITNKLTIKGTNLFGVSYQGGLDPPIHVPELDSFIYSLTSVVLSVIVFYLKQPNWKPRISLKMQILSK